MSKTIPPICPEPDNGPKYWRSLDQLADTPEFRQWVEREFPAGITEAPDPVSRRHFVKIMSASFMLAGMGLTGCRRPEETIQPFSKMPENYIHGVPQYFATSRPVRGSAIPLVVKSHEGRPIKIEGNAQHPDSNGGTDPFTQASILDLYDPDRAMRFARSGSAATRVDALATLDEISRGFAANSGAGLCILADRSGSPSRARLQAVISRKFPKARWFSHEPVDFQIHRDAAATAFGAGVAPFFRLDKAARILSLDCDFIGSEEDPHRLIRDYAKGRKIASSTGELSRLYAVEALMTLTGAQADHRLRVSGSAVLAVAAKLATEVLNAAGVADAASLKSALARFAGATDIDAQWIAACAKDLVEHKGRALVLAGYRQPLAVHLIAHALNVALGAVGQTIEFHRADESQQGIADLAKALNAGEVHTLAILNDNPAYSAPADLDWSATQRKAGTVVRLGSHEDETFAVCDWHFPAAHFLESWGDARTADGTLVPVQPLIAPLFGGVTELEFLARLAGEPQTNPYEIVRETFRSVARPANFEEDWKKFLHDGFLAGSASQAQAARFDWSKAVSTVNSAQALPTPTPDNLEIVFHRDAKVDDGRFNNNGWLMELPEPITKIVWENVILLSKQTADAIGLVIVDKENNDLQVPLVRVTLNGREVEGPAWIQPGMADNVLGLALGYGRSYSKDCKGRVGRGAGYNAYKLRSTAVPYIASGARLAASGRTHKLASTQNHGSMEGRPIIREANLEQYREHPDFAKGMKMHEPEAPRDEQGRPAPLYPNPLDIPDKNGKTPRDKAVHAWGMSIDLNACVGCTACMIACQSENNIPIVGKDQVSHSRELHWIRLDRYYTGSVVDPQVIQQPMLCQHCESAPCESVCPVNATVHDEEGLNVMVYNRCVGTRYCSNNCPYKVRRYNYFDYNRRPLDKLKGPVYSTPLFNTTPDGQWELARWWKNPDKGIRPDDEWELLKLAKNPDVTVRMRGVMEKCTFCIQRIEQAKIAQKVKAGPSGDIEVPDGAIKTACQQACPADAIVFGNIKDPASRVSQLKKSERDYEVLEFLATKPRLTYLARVRNPNPAMPDYHKEPLSFTEWKAKGNTLGHHEVPAGHGAGATNTHAAH